MIILEGPDGAGKTTLLKRITERFEDVAVQPRFSTPDGPLPNLFGLAWDDSVVMNTHPIGVYDRHPVWSEYVYGPIRGAVDPEFLTGVAPTLIGTVARNSLTVLCLPPFQVVDRNCRNSYQMAGVAANTYHMWQGYKIQRVFWPGQLITYDYTSEHQLSVVMSRISLHIAEWRRDHP